MTTWECRECGRSFKQGEDHLCGKKTVSFTAAILSANNISTPAGRIEAGRATRHRRVIEEARTALGTGQKTITEFEALQQQVARMAEDKRELRGQVQDQALARGKAEADVQGLELELEAVRVVKDADVALLTEEREEVARWKEKHFNDAMAAKKSGYEDGKHEAKARVAELEEQIDTQQALDQLKAERDEALKHSVPGLSHSVLTTYGAPSGCGLTLLGRIEALADKSDRNSERRKKAEIRNTELEKQLDRALDAILLASAHGNWGPAHDLCVKYERVLPSTPRPKDPCDELRGEVAVLREAFTETLRELASRDRWCGGALSYTKDGDGMGCSPACVIRKQCAVLFADDAGAPEVAVIKAAWVETDREKLYGETRSEEAQIDLNAARRARRATIKKMKEVRSA